MHRMIPTLLLVLVLAGSAGFAQKKILFDATKAEMAGNADWVIDADQWNLTVNSTTHLMVAGTSTTAESNPQRFPTPLQSAVTSSTAENYWRGALSAWGIAMVKLGYAVESLPYNGRITYGDTTNVQDLSHYHVFVVCEPNISFTSAEKTAILLFVQNGGGLFMVGDHKSSDRNSDGVDSPVIWNDLMQTNSIKANPFGILFNNDNVSPSSTTTDLSPADSVIHGPAGTATQMIFSSGSTLNLNTTANATACAAVYADATRSNAKLLCAYASFGNGRVVVVGDSSPCDDGTGGPGDTLYNGWSGEAGGSHAVLFTNATVWLANAKSTVLPTQLIMFSGTALGTDGVTFAWKTLSETNCLGFYIQERGPQTGVFTSVNGTFTPGHGTTLDSNAYAFTLQPVAPGSHTYRLKQVDLDSTEHFSESITVSVLTGVAEQTSPAAFALEQNWPNPFNPATTIGYTVGGIGDQGSGSRNVKLSIYNLLGQEVAVLVNEKQAPGRYTVRFDGSRLASGVYLYRLQAGSYVETRRMVLLR